MHRSATFIALTWLLASTASGWDAHAHRCVTYLALDGLSDDAPQWLREPAVRHRLAFQSNQPDRWRGWPADTLSHVNDPEHYLDVELLEQFGLTLETIPRLRREYLRAMAIAKHLHPERVDPYDRSRDPARAQEWPGFLPHAIMEQYVKLQAAFNQVRILERLGEPARCHQLAQARAIAIYHLGMLSHLVADAAQPLHTTRHFNGWVGDNPNGYTTSKEFHAYIDGGVIAQHRLTYAKLRPFVKYERRFDATAPWREIRAHIRRAHAQVKNLYRLERDGKLDRTAGRDFVIERLVDATETLSAMIRSAYSAAEPTDKQVATWVEYNDFRPELLPGTQEPPAGSADTEGNVTPRRRRAAGP